LWYHLDQTIESWVGRYDFRSRRFSSVQDERDKHRERRYEIFPDSGFYREQGGTRRLPRYSSRSTTRPFCIGSELSRWRSARSTNTPVIFVPTAIR